MSGWTANFADTKRQKALRLIVLKGEERRLHHARDLLRRDLGYELQQHCRTAKKTAEAIALEQRIHANIGRVAKRHHRDLRSERGAAA